MLSLVPETPFEDAFAPLIAALDPVAHCKCCGRDITGPEWAALPLCANVSCPDGISLGMEWRNCPCRNSTLCVVIGC